MANLDNCKITVNVDTDQLAARLGALAESFEKRICNATVAHREARAWAFFFGFVIGGIVVWLMLHVLKAMA